MAEAQRQIAAGALDTAETLIRRVVAAAPDVSEGYNALGVVLRKAGRLDEAAAAYRTALARDPDNPRALNNLGDVLRARGAPGEAARLIKAALAIDTGRAEAWRNLAQCRHALGDYEGAAAAVAGATRAAPDDPRNDHLLAKIAHDHGRHTDAEAADRRFLAAVPDDIDALTDLGMLLSGRDRDAAAIPLFEAALALAPGHLPAEFGLREAIARLVPPWHIPMMNEPKRNDAYAAAIRAVVRPDDLVLEIGTGAGLLALLAAEAGAKRVVTCEMVDLVAAEAKAIVGRSAHAGRITVVAKKSTALAVGADLPARADVLVSEILANDFVGEGVMPSLLDAKARLLKPGARIVPAKGALMGVLVGGPAIAYRLGLGDVSGFDMASFARLRPWRQAIPEAIDYDALSDDVALVSYDFATLDGTERIETTLPVTATADGLCYGVLQWIALELAPGITYDNHPRTTASVWNKTLYAFPEPRAVKRGDVVAIRLWQQGDYLYLTDG